MQAIFTLAMKDLRLLLRDKPGLFWVLVFPLLMALFFGSIFGGEGGGARSLKIAVVSEDASPLAKQFYEQLAKSAALRVSSMPKDSAQILVKRGQLVAWVEFKSAAEGVFGLFSDESGGIEVGIDPARKAEAGYLNGLINQAYFALLQTTMSDRAGLQNELHRSLAALDTAWGVDENERRTYRQFLGSLEAFMGNMDSVNRLESGQGSTRKSAGMTGPEIKFTDVADERVGPRSSFEITFPQSIQWGLIGTAAAFGLSIVIERTRGTFLRLRLAPISRAHILAGKGLACFIASVVVGIVLMLIGVLIFKVQVASPLGLAAALLSSGVCFVGLMMLMSVIGKTEASVAGAGWGIFLVFSMIGGGMVPLMMMPPWMVTISHFSPIKWSILATEGAIWRGFGISEMLMPLAILCGIGIVGYVAGVSILKRADG